jgi:uncharacterized protein (DUF2336 family)
MNGRTQKLEKLVDLAAEPASERRRELLHEITDLFLEQPTSYTDKENWYFGEIIGDVAFKLETQIRAELAERLSGEATAPPELIRKLANDEIAVARPVIERSPVLSQDDLVEIAERFGQGHLMAIARRPDISEVVSTVLVDRGNDEVVEGLLDNRTAAISHGSMVQIADRAEASDRLKSSLLRRPELPPEMVKDIISTLSQEIRGKILEEASGIDRERLESVLGEIADAQEEKARGQQNVISKPEAAVNDLVASNSLTPRKLIEFAEAGRIPEFVCALAKLAKLDIETAQKVAMDRTGEGLALICRACGLPSGMFVELINALEPQMPKPKHEVDQLLRFYDRITMPTAQRVFRFWRIRRQALGEASAA